MMWQRYRWLLFTAPLLGFTLGVLFGAITALSGTRQPPGGLDLWGAVSAVLPLGLIGTAVAVVALAGGWSMVAARDRGLVRTPNQRAFLAAGGAIVGMLVLALAVGVVFAAHGLFLWFGLIMVCIPVSIVTALAAGWLVYLAERRHVRTPMPPVEHVTASRWADF